MVIGNGYVMERTLSTEAVAWLRAPRESASGWMSQSLRGINQRKRERVFIMYETIKTMSICAFAALAFAGACDDPEYPEELNAKELAVDAEGIDDEEAILHDEHVGDEEFDALDEDAPHPGFDLSEALNPVANSACGDGHVCVWPGQGFTGDKRSFDASAAGKVIDLKACYT